MKVRLLPYMEIDGVRTYPDSFIGELWMEISKLSRHIRDSFEGMNHFIEDMKTNSFLHIVYVDEELAAVFWLNNWKEGYAEMHYCPFKKFRGQKLVEISQEVFRQIFSWGVLEGLIGITPKDNPLAIRMAQKCGWSVLGELPFAFKGNKPGVITYLENKGG